jgi:outer membrane lipoprotein-sorting protein
MKKLIFVFAILGISATAKAQRPGGPVNIPGTYLGESGGSVKNINCQASQDVCCVIWIGTKAGEANTVTVNEKTYTFTRYTTTTDENGNSTLTFEDAQPR